MDRATSPASTSRVESLTQEERLRAELGNARDVRDTLIESNAALERQNRELSVQLEILRSAYKSLKQRSSVLRDILEDENVDCYGPLTDASIVNSAQIVLGGMESSVEGVRHRDDASRPYDINFVTNAHPLFTGISKGRQVKCTNCEITFRQFEDDVKGFQDQSDRNPILFASSAPRSEGNGMELVDVRKSNSLVRHDRPLQSAWKRGRKDPSSSRMQLNLHLEVDHDNHTLRQTINLQPSKLQAEETENVDPPNTKARAPVSLCTRDDSPMAGQKRGRLHPLVRDDACSPYWWLGFPNPS